MQELEEYDNMVENQEKNQHQMEEEVVIKEPSQNYEENFELENEFNTENDTFVHSLNQKEDLLNEAVASVSEKDLRDLRDISLNESFKKKFNLNISELNNSNEEVYEMKSNTMCKLNNY